MAHAPRERLAKLCSTTPNPPVPSARSFWFRRTPCIWRSKASARSASPSEDQWDDHGYYDEDEDDYGDDPDPDDYELTDLIDSEISLGWWTSPSGKGGESISLHVPDPEVCATARSLSDHMTV